MFERIKYNYTIHEYEVRYKLSDVRTASWLAQKYHLACSDSLTVFFIHQSIVLNGTDLNALKRISKAIKKDVKALKKGHLHVDETYMLPSQFKL